MQKKVFTLTMILAVALPIVASDSQQAPILNVEGNVQKYASSVYWIREDGSTSRDDGIIASICTASDGTDVYIRDLMPAWAEGWLKGSASEGELHFPSGQIVSQWGIGDIYMGAYIRDRRNGNMLPVDEFVLSPGENGTYTLADRGGETIYLKAYLLDGTTLETDYGLTLTPFNFTEAEPSADAKIEEYTRIYFDGISKYPYSDTVKVARKGSDLWLEGFNGSSTGYVAGTLTDEGDIFIPSDQYVGQSGSYAFFMYAAVTNSGIAIDTPGLTLYKEESGWASGQDALLMFGFNKEQIEFRHYNYRLEKYTTEGISSESIDSECVHTEYYDLTGRKVVQPCRGINIAVRKYADGTRRTVREIIR